MTSKKFLTTACAAIFAAVCTASSLSAQSPPADPGNGRPDDSLQMVVNYGPGKENRRHAHRGIMEAVGLPLRQAVGIRLEFPVKWAGLPVVVSCLDGGEIIASQMPLPVSANGRVEFGFKASTPGLYRLLVHGAEQYELQLYVVDPSRPVTPPRGPGAH